MSENFNYNTWVKEQPLNLSSVVTQVNRPLQQLTFNKLPTDLCDGDVVFISPLGEVRGRTHWAWYQRAWNAIDERVRGWLGMNAK